VEHPPGPPRPSLVCASATRTREPRLRAPPSSVGLIQGNLEAHHPRRAPIRKAVSLELAAARLHADFPPWLPSPSERRSARGLVPKSSKELSCARFVADLRSSCSVSSPRAAGRTTTRVRAARGARLRAQGARAERLEARARAAVGRTRALPAERTTEAPPAARAFPTVEARPGPPAPF